LAAIALGWSARSGSSSGESSTSATFACVAVSMTETERPIQLVTSAFVPVRSNATPSGWSRWPRSIVFSVAPVAGSITVTVPPAGLPAAPPAGPERLFAT
jgi:hypothetical protein